MRETIERVFGARHGAGGFLTEPALKLLAKEIANNRAGDLTGTTISHYRIVEMLGVGGMGEVYLAEDNRLGRKVAVKLLPVRFTTNIERVRRFEWEARAASSLNHPNIITLYDIGEIQGRRYIVEEFVDGKTLRQLMTDAPRKRMDLDAALEITVQIAAALAAAHEAGIVHRDIKPDNVMVRRDGLVKVLDFGLAKLAERTEPPSAEIQVPAPAIAKTSSGTVMGTVGYMSPEQALGHEVDHRTDIFSMGVMMWELLTGKKPFDGAITEEPSLSAPPALPPQVRRMINRMLEKERDARYPSAAQLRSELQLWRRKAARDQTFKPGRRSVVTGIVAALLGGIIYSNFFSAAPPPAEIKSLAVLPFKNGSDDLQAEYLSDGMNDSLINKLSQLPGLRVKARSAVSRYARSEVNPQQAGNDLGVEAVLSGMVAERGNSLLVQAELVRVADGAQLWGERYNRQPGDILAIQEEVARKIVEELHLKLTGAGQQQLARRYTENIEAYNLYLKGRYHERQFTEEHVKTGIDYFRKAIEKDPNYALAYSGLADSYVALGTYYFLSPTDAFAQAAAAASRAVELDPTLSEAYVSLAIVRVCYDWDWADYEENVRQARQLNPNYAKLYYLHSQYLAAMGRFEEARAEAKMAEEFESPLDISTNVGWILYFARRYDEAIAQYVKAIDLDPGHFRPHRLLGLAYLQRKQSQQAIAAIQQSVALSGGSLEEKAYLGYAYALAGRRSEALKIMRELRQQAQTRYVSPYLMALVAVGLGDKDEAFAWLDRAYDARSVNLIYMNVEPILDSIRSDPRFIQLRQRVGLPNSN